MKKYSLMSIVILTSIGLTKVEAEINTDVIDEAWGKPTIVYGAGLNDIEVIETNNLFEITNPNNVNKQVVYGDDLEVYLGYQNTADSSLYSSALVKKKEDGGVTIKIIGDNIQKISADEYRNAAITAGATNVDIEVGSVIPVTGESALAGVYKALEANGEELDTTRTAIADEELSLIDAINEANNTKENFRQELLNNVLIEVKTRLAEENLDGVQSTADEVEVIVNEALKNNSLDGVISEDEVFRLVEFAKSYQNTSAVTDKNTLEQLNKFQEELATKVSEYLDEINGVQWYDKAIEWVKNLFSSIKAFFS